MVNRNCQYNGNLQGRRFTPVFFFLLLFFALFIAPGHTYAQEAQGINEPPDSPRLSSPPAGAVGVTQPITLSWRATARATVYELQVANDVEFTSIVFEEENLIATSYTLDWLAIGERYFWRVRAVNQDGTSAYSSIWDFVTQRLPSAPELLEPEDGTEELPTTLTFSWVPPAAQGRGSQPAAPEVISNYWLEITTDTLSSIPDYQNFQIMGTSKVVESLARETEYHWRVKARNETGWGEFSGWFSFSTLSNAPAQPPNLIFPGNNAVNISANFLFIWSSVEDAETYDLQIALNGDFSDIVYERTGLTDTSEAVALQNYKTLHFWRVRASNTGGQTGWSQVYRFTTNVEPPATPVKIAPVAGATGLGQPVEFRWTSARLADRYVLHIATDISFQNTYYRVSSISDTVHSVDGFDNRTTYFWRVAGVNEGGIGTYTEPSAFRTVGMPLQPKPIEPPDNAANQPLEITFIWNEARELLRSASVNAITMYHFQLSRNSSFSSIVVDNQAVEDTQFTVSALQRDTQYWWRVAARNSAGTGEWSDVYMFSTAANIPDTAPVLEFPSNGSEGMPVELSLRWSEVNLASSYHVQVSTSTTFSTMAYEEENNAGTELTITGLNNGTQYYWRARGQSIGGAGPWSAPFSFSTRYAVPDVPAPLLPLSGATDVETPLQLRWASADAAETYTLQYGADITFQLAQTIEGIPDTSFEISALQNNTRYYWRVKSVNPDFDSDYSDPFSFNTALLAPSVALVAPGDGTVDVSVNVTLQWEEVEPVRRSVAEVDVYQLRIGADAAFDSVIFSDNELTVTEYAYPNFEFGETYYWQVRGRNASGWGEYTDVFSFTTVALTELPTPLIYEPENGIDNADVVMNFVYSLVEAAKLYRIQVSEDAAFTEPVIDREFADTSFVISIPLYRTQYYWRVRAERDDLLSPWSEVRSFTTGEGPPGSVSPIDPFDGTQDQPLNVTFIWSYPAKSLRNDASMRYDFELSLSTGATPEVVRTGLSDTTTSVMGLITNTTYYWRVKASNDKGEGDFTRWYTFATGDGAAPAPDLVYPRNGATSVPLQPVLEWEAVSDFSLYHLQFSDNPEFEEPLVDTTAYSGTTFTLGELEASTDYYWRVRVDISEGGGPFSRTAEFTTIGRPSVVPIVTPEHNSFDQPVSVTFTWRTPNETAPLGRDASGRKPATITKFWFELYSDTTGQPVVIEEELTDTTITVNDLENDTEYLWRVRAFNEFGWGGYGTWWRFTTVALDFSQINLMSPPNGETNVSTPVEFVWTALPDILFYQLQVATTPSFNRPVFDNYVNDSVRTVTGLNLSTTYYWRVKGILSASETDFTTANSFTTVGQGLTAPTGLVLIPQGTSQVSLVWNDNSTGETGFRIERKTDAASSVYEQIGTSAANTPNYTDNSVIEGTTYLYRVYAFTDASVSDYSNEAEITIGGGVPGGVPSEYELLQNYPNPFNPSTTIAFGLPVASSVKVRIYNSIGEEVSIITTAFLDAGYHFVQWAPSGLSSGAYFYSITAVSEDELKTYVNFRKMLYVK